MGRRRVSEGGMLVAGIGFAAAAACALSVGRTLGEVAFLFASPAPPWPTPGARLRRQSQVARSAVPTPSGLKVNEDISASEVRVVGMWNDDVESPGMDETNEIIATIDALRIARERGQDVVMFNEAADPPLVKIVKASKFLWEQKKAAKAKEKGARMPKIKEIKMAYTIGDHDLYTRLNNIKRWMAANKRQQVQLKVMMKGRTRMFEAQARDLLLRVQEETSGYAKVPGLEKGNPVMSKDSRGDLIMLLGNGPDLTIQKRLKAEGRLPEARGDAQADDAGDDDDDEDEDDDADEDDAGGAPEDVKAILAEIQEMREELLDCGIKPGQLDQQEEMKELNERLMAAQGKSKVGARAFGAVAAGRAAAGSFVLAAGATALVGLLRPRRL